MRSRLRAVGEASHQNIHGRGLGGWALVATEEEVVVQYAVGGRNKPKKSRAKTKLTIAGGVSNRRAHNLS